MQPVTTVSAGQAPRRLDVFVATQTAHLSRAAAQRWIDGGLITVNGRRTKPARLIRPGDVITCHVPVREPPPVEPEPLALHVLHEDAELLVIDKPPGLVMHPGPGHWTGTCSTRSCTTSATSRERLGGAPGPDWSIASTRARAGSS